MKLEEYCKQLEQRITGLSEELLNLIGEDKNAKGIEGKTGKVKQRTITGSA